MTRSICKRDRVLIKSLLEDLIGHERRERYSERNEEQWIRGVVTSISGLLCVVLEQVLFALEAKNKGVNSV